MYAIRSYYALAGDWQAVEEDICCVVRAAGDAPVKLILECSALSEQDKLKAAQVALEAGAAFLKTSTGYGA